MPSFYIQNFGCRAAQADGAAIEHDLITRGLSRASSADSASLVVLNTCTVTAAADQDARTAIRRVHRRNPAGKLLVTGCYAQRAPDEIRAIPGVTWVVGNSHKHLAAEIVAPGLSQHTRGGAFVPLAALHSSHASQAAPATFVSDIFAHTELLAAPVFGEHHGDAATGDRTRPNLKVQDGCGNRCSFCVIPYVRGNSRSLRLGEVLREVNSLVAAGYKEVVLSGINLGRWGRDLPPQDEAPQRRVRFPQLVRAILDCTALAKLRISSVEPMDWSRELIALMAGSDRIARHAHLPLQSGSDAVLRRMHRKYRPWHYAERIAEIHAAMPGAALGADVMVGFPGETDAEFEDSRRFIAALPFTYLHVFTYSPRPGTPAAAMKSQVPADVARHRNCVLRELAAQKNLSFRRKMLGCVLPAITLARPAGAEASAHTPALSDNFLKLTISGEHAANCWRNVRVTSLSDEGLCGEVVAGA